MGGARGDRGLNVVGAGRLASALVPALCGAGHPVARVSARRATAARSLTRHCAGVKGTTGLTAVAEARGPVLLAVSDRAIGPIAERLAGVRPEGWRNRVVLHCAGALGPDLLAPLRAVGASVGVLHPLQVLTAGVETRATLRGSRARIEGDPRACAYARRVCRSLGLIPLASRVWTDADRSAYHAAAALASNDVVALLGEALDLLDAMGLSRDEALDALLPLTRGTLKAVEGGGLQAALTGPAARGDRATLERHDVALRSRSPDAAAAHRHLSRRLRARALAAARRG